MDGLAGPVEGIAIIADDELAEDVALESSGESSDEGDEWDEHLQLITQLYWTERRPLPAVMRLMAEKHGFHKTYDVRSLVSLD
jgi:hypothetical protein